jgi:hypothetical protein
MVFSGPRSHSSIDPLRFPSEGQTVLKRGKCPGAEQLAGVRKRCKARSSGAANTPHTVALEACSRSWPALPTRITAANPAGSAKAALS